MKKITILIIEDHVLLREAWTSILESNQYFHVVAGCSSGERAMELAKTCKPEVVLMDINLRGMNGIDATEKILEVSPSTKVLCISLHAKPAYAKKIIKQGGMGYVTKNSPIEEMLLAILEISKGKKYICKEIKDRLVEESLNGEEPKERVALSERELEIVIKIKEGLSSKEIANSLNISVKTVDVHRYNILKKLRLKNVTSMISYIHNHISALRKY